MLLDELRREVLEANLELVRRGLVIYTFGNVSGISRKEKLVVIKPSGVPYEKMCAEQMVVCDLNGEVVEGNLKPSSDLATHLVLYREFSEIGGVVHTHSEIATSWAQSGREIPCFGTTHADYFYGPIPITDELSTDDIKNHYEENTGKAIARRFRSLDYRKMPAVIVKGHGPFSWGENCAEAVHNSVILESVAKMAMLTRQINSSAQEIPQTLLDKHFLRKHGATAYYGQQF